MNKQTFELLTPEISEAYTEYLKLQLQMARLIDFNPPLKDLIMTIEGKQQTHTPGSLRFTPWRCP